MAKKPDHYNKLKRLSIRGALIRSWPVLVLAVSALNCTVNPNLSKGSDANETNFLPSISKLEEFNLLAKKDDIGSKFVKFTWEFKTQKQNFVFQNTTKWPLHPDFLK